MAKKKEKYGKSPAMDDLLKVKADNKKAIAKLKKKKVTQENCDKDINHPWYRFW